MVENFFPDEITLDEDVSKSNSIEITTLSGNTEHFIVDKEPSGNTIEPLIDNPLYVRNPITLAD